MPRQAVDTMALTLYTSKQCPASQRVELALAEAKANYQRYEIDLWDKPTWYASQVNTAGKVPAASYGSLPTAPPDQPSPDSVKITESLVLLEFVADLYPEANLLPKDPVLRAKARFFIDCVTTKFVPVYMGYIISGKDSQADVIKLFKEFQDLLHETGYAVGEWSLADAAIAPFFARMFLAMENDLGMYAVGEGPKTLEILRTSSELQRIQKYVQDVTTRQSFIETFSPSVALDGWVRFFKLVATGPRASPNFVPVKVV